MADYTWESIKQTLREKLREDRGNTTDASRECDIKFSTLTSFSNGGSLGPENVFKLAKHFGYIINMSKVG